jgi:hypothetical protein
LFYIESKSRRYYMADFVTHQIEGVPVWVYTNEDLEILEWVDDEERLTGETSIYGWHGLSRPPSPGKWIADREEGTGALVILEDLDCDDEACISEYLGNLPGGWEWCKASSVNEGWYFVSDGGEWRVCCLHMDNNGVGKFVGMI